MKTDIDLALRRNPGLLAKLCFCKSNVLTPPSLGSAVRQKNLGLFVLAPAMILIFLYNNTIVVKAHSHSLLSANIRAARAIFNAQLCVFALDIYDSKCEKKNGHNIKLRSHSGSLCTVMSAG